MVFYNAYLPDIAVPAEQDAVSSKGFAYGYVGGGLLLALNLLLFQVLSDTAVAVRLSLGSAGVWWLFFTWLYPQRRLIERKTAVLLPPHTNLLTHSAREFMQTLRQMKNKTPQALHYLIAYLIYNDGIMTVNTVAAIFAASELGMGPEQLDTALRVDMVHCLPPARPYFPFPCLLATPQPITTGLRHHAEA